MPITWELICNVCTLTRDLVLGSLTVTRSDGQLLACRAEGALFQPAANGSGALVLLAMIPTSVAGRGVAETDRCKDEFLALLGHELRNPLAPIRNAVRLLELQPDKPAVVAEARAIIGRQTAQMTHLVDELLDASRIVRRKVKLRREGLDLADLVRVAAQDHRAELEAAGLVLRIDVPNVPVRIQGDATRLNQVLGNLLHNAAKFTERGGRITVRLVEEAGLAALSVADTGLGIDPLAVPRLFGAFNQLDATLERGKGGLGLGLSVVRGLIELHGGFVEAASGGRGRGSVFTVRIPLDQRPAPAPTAPAPVAAPDGGRRKILIVEDGRDAAESLRMLLSLQGFDVAVAYTGPEGVARARQFHPEAVICDLGLPGMSGFEVARALRSEQETASALLVCVSGYGQDEDKRQARVAGFDDTLVKPVDPEALVRLLAQPNRNQQESVR